MTKTFRLRGFTLLELLLVIAIIALLAAMILPTLSKAKWMAKNTVCKSNARQLALGLSLYVTDHSVYPVYKNRGMHESWLWAMFDYAAAPVFVPHNRSYAINFRYHGEMYYSVMVGSVYRCPLDKGSLVKVRPSFVTMPFSSYGYNRSGVGIFNSGAYNQGLGLGGKQATAFVTGGYLYGYTNALSDSAVKVPSRMIALGDSFIRSLGYGDGEQSMYADIGYGFQGLHLPMPLKENLTFKNHRGKFNFAFADGHVEVENMNGWVTPSHLTEEKMRRWNNDHEPHREAWNSPGAPWDFDWLVR